MSRNNSMQRILITGGSGRIGNVLREGLYGRYELIRLSDIAPTDPARPGEEIVTADICNLAATEATMEGIDCVIHLAGVSDEDTWENIHPMNLLGCFNVFEAARRQGVKRVIFASSNHTVGFHRREKTIDTQVQPRPDSRYGVSKVYGEAVGRLYADKHGVSCACLRIGSCRPEPEDIRQLGTWLSYPDTVHLVERCIDHPDYHFFVVYGVSANDRNKWDNSKVDFLGYRPNDNAESHAERLLGSGETEEPVAATFHGGGLCAGEMSGDIDRID